MKDNYGRDIYYLRISVTDLCNLRCIYCMPECGESKMRHEELLSVDEIINITRAAAVCGINKVRVTGGEPLVRNGILDICKGITETDGITELCLTTNGVLLPKYAQDLKKAGVKRLNISLDTLNADTYKDITRTGTIENALKGIDAAFDAGFEFVKLNAVLIGGVNDGEIQQLLNLTIDRPINVRFIELMPIGQSANWAESRFVSASKVLETAPELSQIGSDGVAALYKMPNGKGTVGLIRPISSHFCPTCNRIRVTADGKLKPCLHSATEINLRGLPQPILEQTMKDAISLKPRKHKLDDGQVSSSARNMNAIGG